MSRILGTSVGLIAIAVLVGAGPAQASVYHERGFIDVPTLTVWGNIISPCSIFPGTQGSIGNGWTVWQLNPGAIAGNNGRSFSLRAASGEDFDICFYTSAGAFIQGFGNAGDEFGTIPGGATQSYVVLFCCTPDYFDFDIA